MLRQYNMQQYKIAILGFGVVGKRRFSCLEKNPRCNIVAICDKHADMDIAKQRGISIYENYTDILNHKEIDAAFVCLSNDMLAEVSEAFLRKGIHVFCEKPPARNTKELQKVLEAEKHIPKLKLMYGFNHRYHESVQDSLQIIRDGTLGRVINARGIYGKSRLITYNQTEWRTSRELAGGGVLLDQGIHMVDLMRLFCGEFNEIKSFVSNDHWQFDVEGNAYALMKTAGGVVGMLHSSATQWRHRFELEISLTKGALRLAGILSGSKSYGEETLRVTWADENGTGDPKEQITRYNMDSSWQQEVDLFIDSIIHDKKITSGSSYDAYQTLKTVESIYHADNDWKQKINKWENRYECIS
jgi:predicted dehydrogenase